MPCFVNDINTVCNIGELFIILNRPMIVMYNYMAFHEWFQPLMIFQGIVHYFEPYIGILFAIAKTMPCSLCTNSAISNFILGTIIAIAQTMPG